MKSFKNFFFKIFNIINNNKKIFFVNSKKNFSLKLSKYNFLVVSFKNKFFFKVIFFLLKNKIKFKKNFFLIYENKKHFHGKYLIPMWSESNKYSFFYKIINWIATLVFLKNFNKLKYIIITLEKNDARN